MTEKSNKEASAAEQTFDIVIIGGGMVGASLAAALLPAAQSLDLQIAMIESQQAQAERQRESGEEGLRPSREGWDEEGGDGDGGQNGRAGGERMMADFLDSGDPQVMADHALYTEVCTQLGETQTHVRQLYDRWAELEAM